MKRPTKNALARRTLLAGGGGNRCGSGVGERGGGRRGRTGAAGGTRAGGRRGGAAGGRADRVAPWHPPAPRDAGQEQRTAGVVAQELRAAGLDVTTGVGGHGVVGVLAGARPGRTVAYRADMDAVPPSDRSGAARSGPPLRARRAHRCGLGVAQVLARLRQQPHRHRGVPLPARRGDAHRGRRDARRGRARANPSGGDPCLALRSFPRRPVRWSPRVRAAGPGPRHHHARGFRRDGAGAAARRRDRRARHGVSPGRPRGPGTARGRHPDTGRAVGPVRRSCWPASRRRRPRRGPGVLPLLAGEPVRRDPRGHPSSGRDHAAGPGCASRPTRFPPWSAPSGKATHSSGTYTRQSAATGCRAARRVPVQRRGFRAVPGPGSRHVHLPRRPRTRRRLDTSSPHFGAFAPDERAIGYGVRAMAGWLAERAR